MRFKLAIITVLSFAVYNCSNLDSADPAPRNTFIKFYEGSYSISATSVEIVGNEFVILGNMLVEDKVNDTTFFETVVFKVDKNGNRISDFNPSPGGIGKSIKPLYNGLTVDGYVVIGDSIYLDPLAEQAANVIVSSMRILILDANFEPLNKIYLTDTTEVTPNGVRIDYTGESITTKSDGQVILLGTRKAGVVNQQTAPAEPFVVALTSDRNDFDWYKLYELNGRTSQNSKSIYTNEFNQIIWASAISDVQGEFTSSWVSIPIVDEQSTFPNYSVIGQTSDQLFIAKDIHPAQDSDFGYGVVGTFSKETDGAKGNVFFFRVYNDGTIVPGSDRYFDGIDSEEGQALADSTVSSIIDEGEAITSTQDGGFVLAGTMTTNPNKGNGGKDLLLIKLNSIGDILWLKTIGGSGDEVPTAIRETTDGSLIICGTNTLGDYSSVFLIKTDKDGLLTK